MTGAREWLSANRTLRMDANDELFPQERRDFHKDRYEFAKTYCDRKDVLDAACGTGYGSAILAAAAKSVVGLDIDTKAIEYAVETYGQRDDIQFVNGCVEFTSFEDSSFDLVVSFETVEHTLCPGSHFREIVRLLKPDGIAIVSVPNSWGLTDHHFWDFDLGMLKSLVSENFQSAEYFYNNSNSLGGRSKGIGKLTAENGSTAECIIAICSLPTGTEQDAPRLERLMEDIYTGVFERHRANLNAQLQAQESFLFGRLGVVVDRFLIKAVRRLRHVLAAVKGK